jgi:hypothetical protein
VDDHQEVVVDIEVDLQEEDTEVTLQEEVRLIVVLEDDIKEIEVNRIY